jgi:hypothetical protein
VENFDSQMVREAKYARNVASAHYLLNPRVTLIDIGWRIKETEDKKITKELAVRVHLMHKPREAAFETFQASNPNLVIEKERIPFPVVDLVEANYPLQWSWWPTRSTDRRAQVFDPLQGGISVSTAWSYGYGTLGGIVIDRETGQPMILSNWHVLAESVYAPKGLSIYQPGYGDGGRSNHTVAHLERHAILQGIDAAAATLTDQREWTNDQLDIGSVTGVTAPALGMQVIKSGRQSQITRGMVDGIGGDYPIRIGGYPRTIKHVHRIVPVTPDGEVSRAGDSGSWWLEEKTKKAAALHFAGSDFPELALAIAMPQVLEALNIELALKKETLSPELGAQREETREAEREAIFA